jgi:hypothetical protein
MRDNLRQKADLRADLRVDLAVAYDPGAITGWATWGSDGLVASGQGTAEEAMLRSLPLLRGARVVCACIEAPFLGRGAGSSLSVAAAGGWIKGALWAAGITPADTWAPLASAWRKELGWTGSVDGRRKKRADWEEEARSFAAPHLGGALLVKQTHQAEAVCMAAATWERWIAGRK